MHRRTVLVAFAALIGLVGCAGNWKVDYDAGVGEDVSRNWRVADIQVRVPDELTLSENNSLAPNADIVWHGEERGDRKAQVKAILDEAFAAAVSDMNGQTPVILVARLGHFHAVTPAAVSRAPAAVHNMSFAVRIFDAKTHEPLTESEWVRADLEAYVGASAVTAALEGNTQRVRIVRHLTAVMRGWLGVGPDQRREFHSIGR